MSRKKISELTSTTDLVSGDVFVVNDGGTTKKVDFDVLQEKVRGYKVYSALLTQSGTNAPTAKELQTIAGVTMTYGYTSTGFYTITASSAIFTEDKTQLWNTDFTSYYSPATGVLLEWVSNTVVNIYTREAGVLLQSLDDLLQDTPIEIRVYE